MTGPLLSARRLSVFDEDGELVSETTVDAFIRSNETLSPEETDAIIALAVGETYASGGGAWSEWSVRRDADVVTPVRLSREAAKARLRELYVQRRDRDAAELLASHGELTAGDAIEANEYAAGVHLLERGAA